MSEFWNNPDALDPATVLVYGPTKVGKTTWAVEHMPEPVFVCDTENRAGLPVQRAISKGRKVLRKSCATLADVKATVQAAIREGQGRGTFVFDGGSDLLAMAEDEYLTETKATKVWPKVSWGQVYRKIDCMLEALKRRGFFVVIVCQEHPLYVNDKPTDKMIPDGYKKFPEKSDLVLRHDGKQLVTAHNGLSRGAPKPLPLDSSWEKVYDAHVSLGG